MNENNDNSSSSSNNNNGDGQQAQSVDKTINRWGGEELNEIYINAIVSRGNHIQRGKQLSTIPHRMSRMTQKVVSVWGAYRLLHPLPVALPIHPGSSRMIHCSDVSSSPSARTNRYGGCERVETAIVASFVSIHNTRGCVARVIFHPKHNEGF